MSKVYLKRFVPYLGLVLKRSHQYPGGEEEYEEEKKRIRLLEREAERLTPLNMYINDALRKAKPVFGNPPSRCTFWALSKDPKTEPYFEPEPPYLYVDVDFAPEDLFNLGSDKTEIGERGIDLVEEALSKLQVVPGFPADIIREGCEECCKNDYTRYWKFYQTTIPSTKIKCQIDMEASGADTKRIFTASYRGKILIKKQISQIDRPDFSFEKLKDDIVLEGHNIFIKPKLWRWEVEAQADNPQSYYTDAKIDLSDYPDVLELIKK
ncbi:MAG: hypothetical protein ABJ327_25935 [Litoreibacter sp.]